MAAHAKALPPDWSKILDAVHARLDQAIASVDARVEYMPREAPESLAQERRREIAQWCDRLHRLNTFVESAEQIVQSVDELLHQEESHLRRQLATCETLRQKAG